MTSPRTTRTAAPRTTRRRSLTRPSTKLEEITGKYGGSTRISQQPVKGALLNKVPSKGRVALRPSSTNGAQPHRSIIIPRPTSKPSPQQLRRGFERSAEKANAVRRRSERHLADAASCPANQEAAAEAEEVMSPEQEQVIKAMIGAAMDSVRAQGPDTRSEEEMWEEHKARVRQRTSSSAISGTASGTTTTTTTTSTVTVTSRPPRGKENIEVKELTYAERKRAAYLFLDAQDRGDPMMMPQHADACYTNMRAAELEYVPEPAYMDQQREISWECRAVLVDWMIEIHEKINLKPETLYIAVNYVDRFLSCRIVSLTKLQLVGVAALTLAAKYEETIAPSVGSYTYMMNDAFTENDIYLSERYMLSVLSFSFNYPSPIQFLRRASMGDLYEDAPRSIAKYLLEVSLMDHTFLPHPPSLLAAAALWVGREVMERGPWDEFLVECAGYAEEEVLPIARQMVEYLRADRSKESAYKKYASRRYGRVSIRCERWVKEVAL